MTRDPAGAMPAFVRRHVGATGDDAAEMCRAVGVPSAEELLAVAMPKSVFASTPAADSLPSPIDETQVLTELHRIASRNTVTTSLLGLGYYGTITPEVIKRNVLENPSWYTAYTPYQPEISQGRLEALLAFQTMVEELTALPVANASMLDEATAVAEGMLLARRASRSRSAVFAVDADLLPQTRAVVENRAAALDIEVREFRLADDGTPEGLPAEVFGVAVQYPGASGRVVDPAPAIRAAHERKALAVVAADILGLVMLTPPGELGADVVVGSTQRFGVPMGFGGPHAGYMAVRSGLERQMPGRLVGVSQDADGAPALRLALQTREQHIRRERATSNICTAQVLLAVMAGMYAVYHGPDGLRRIASAVADRAARLALALSASGLRLRHASYFDTLEVSVPGLGADAVVARAAADGIDLRRVDAETVALSVDETTTEGVLVRVLSAFGADPSRLDPPADLMGFPDRLRRFSTFLEEPLFRDHHSETSMMRFLKRLADRDYALDRGMIPLGSCTMKLNAAVEMAAITWPEFADIHPFAPRERVEGYLELIGDLETWLAALTGYDAVSLQPNAGSQGELTGLLAIRGYLDAKGESQRRICLIPSSAHGTNAASAALAGLKVVVVACDDDGNVDLADLRAKIEESGDRLAALMITYPSTHGVYEPQVSELCKAVHDAGGQVYIDGANLNALVGFARPGEFGGDVSHLNLHKTFCIPHGGGGPGVGPVAARSHLAPYLPGHPFALTHPDRGLPVSAAPYGSPSILPISWAYLRLMGVEGLRAATASAVLAANYVAARLAPVYPILYTEPGGRVAHECILDLRPLTKETGITVDDVAKRLVDYGFHAPTMSFPVVGTLMVEPTESEPKDELDRFIEAMRAIYDEAHRVAEGTWPADDNPLVNAPHTARQIASDTWDHPYSRETAVFPAGAETASDKYWPPVRRIDGAWGDRHLVCTCAPIEAYA